MGSGAPSLPPELLSCVHPGEESQLSTKPEHPAAAISAPRLPEEPSQTPWYLSPNVNGHFRGKPAAQLARQRRGVRCRPGENPGTPEGLSLPGLHTRKLFLMAICASINVE